MDQQTPMARLQPNIDRVVPLGCISNRGTGVNFEWRDSPVGCILNGWTVLYIPLPFFCPLQGPGLFGKF